MYLRAISAYGHGSDPYSAQSNLMFVYSPLVLEMMNLGRLVFPGPILWYLYLALACTASLCLPVLVSLCLGIRWLSISISILIFSLLPGFMGEFSMLSGNIAVVLYAMILSPLLFALHTNRWSWFYVAVILSALIKTTYARLSPVSTFARIHHSRFPFRSCSSSGLSPSAPVHARSLSSLRPGRIHTARSHRRHGIRALFQTPDATPYSSLFFLQRASPAFCGTCELPDGARRPGSGCQ